MIFKILSLSLQRFPSIFTLLKAYIAVRVPKCVKHLNYRIIMFFFFKELLINFLIRKYPE